MDLTKTLPDNEYLRLLEEIEPRPVFIMGAARSGTTVLYHMLAKTGSFNYVTVYHILKERELLKNRIQETEENARNQIKSLFETAGLTTRLMDHVPVGTDMPEEYGFFLHRRTGPLWLTKKNLPLFIEFCKKVQFLSEPGLPLLLKNPVDCCRFLMLHAAFPDARFIFIHRHPVNVINSQLKAMQNNWKEGNPYLALLSPKLGRGYKNPLMRAFMRKMLSSSMPMHPMRQILLRQAVKTERLLLQSLGTLPEKTYVSLRYEDFCLDPKTVMHKIFQFLELMPREEIDYEKMVAPRTDRLLPEVEQARKKICRKLKGSMEQQGYTKN